MARMGAEVTGVDLSSTSIEQANKLAEIIGVKANFIESNIYDLPNLLHDQFDIVYTSYGVIGWLEDLDKWAKTINRYLKPSGQLIFLEFHPVLWMYDNDFTKVAYDYFKSEIIVEEEEGSYGDRTVKDKIITMTYNHSLGEVMSALIHAGLKITHFDEYPYSPYNCLSHMHKIDEEKYKISKFEKDIPMIYSILCSKE
jgi:ubiquinone/menaquinone biosynthesis C-methylase UbiE